MDHLSFLAGVFGLASVVLLMLLFTDILGYLVAFFLGGLFGTGVVLRLDEKIKERDKEVK